MCHLLFTHSRGTLLRADLIDATYQVFYFRLRRAVVHALKSYFFGDCKFRTRLALNEAPRASAMTHIFVWHVQEAEDQFLMLKNVLRKLVTHLLVSQIDVLNIDP